MELYQSGADSYVIQICNLKSRTNLGFHETWYQGVADKDGYD